MNELNDWLADPRRSLDEMDGSNGQREHRAEWRTSTNNNNDNPQPRNRVNATFIYSYLIRSFKHFHHTIVIHFYRNIFY